MVFASQGLNDVRPDAVGRCTFEIKESLGQVTEIRAGLDQSDISCFPRVKRTSLRHPSQFHAHPSRRDHLPTRQPRCQSVPVSFAKRSGGVSSRSISGRGKLDQTWGREKTYVIVTTNQQVHAVLGADIFTLDGSQLKREVDVLIEDEILVDPDL